MPIDVHGGSRYNVAHGSLCEVPPVDEGPPDGIHKFLQPQIHVSHHLINMLLRFSYFKSLVLQDGIGNFLFFSTVHGKVGLAQAKHIQRLRGNRVLVPPVCKCKWELGCSTAPQLKPCAPVVAIVARTTKYSHH